MTRTRYILPSGVELEPTPIIQAVLDFAKEAAHRPTRRVIVAPPAHGKTLAVAHALPLLLREFSGRRHGYFTHSTEQARWVAEEVAEDWDILTGAVGGALTGECINGVAIVDDPFLTCNEAASPDRRAQVWGWFQDVLLTRLVPEASVLVIQSRRHDEDLAHLLEREGWPVTVLPAVSDDGQPLCPSLWSAERLERMRTALGPTKFEMVFQGKRHAGPEWQNWKPPPTPIPPGGRRP